MKKYLNVPKLEKNPDLFFTIKGNSASELVIQKMMEIHGTQNGLQFHILKELPNENLDPLHSFAFFDGPEKNIKGRSRSKSNKNFSPVHFKKPQWVGSCWAIMVAKNISDERAVDCANQVLAWASRSIYYLDAGQLPWSSPNNETFVFHGNIPQIQAGQVVRQSYESSMGFFQYFENYQVEYPEVVIKALCELYVEYNQAFEPLIEANREWETDYKHCFINGSPVNFGIQIDMLGLTDKALQGFEIMSVEEVKEILRFQIYEMENSLAMYQLLQVIGGENSFFKARFRAWLENIRNITGKKIALLAVTEGKEKAMLETEFGVLEGSITDEEVYRLSGFDRFFGPNDFLKHLENNGGQCNYLLVCRTSDPVAKLKDPKHAVEHLLLSIPEVRKIIKECSLTLNIDAPDMAYDKRINDTKQYMSIMGMAYKISSVKALEALPFDGSCMLRAKPLKGTYGCYGHLTGLRANKKFRDTLATEIDLRGEYIVQKELRNSLFSDGEQLYAYIDRVFFAIVDGKPSFLGGFRNCLPTNDIEVKKGRIHGNGHAVWAPIVS